MGLWILSHAQGSSRQAPGLCKATRSSWRLPYKLFSWLYSEKCKGPSMGATDAGPEEAIQALGKAQACDELNLSHHPAGVVLDPGSTNHWEWDSQSSLSPPLD